MAHSIELLLDERADTAIRQLWQDLANAGLPSQLRVASDTNRPHITLIAAERIAPDIDAPLAELAENLPIPAILGAPLIFGGGGRMTLARLVVPSGALLALHDGVYDVCRPFVSGLFSHSAPGQWTPHVTLGRRFAGVQAGEALAIDGIAADIRASIVGLRRWDGGAKRECLID